MNGYLVGAVADEGDCNKKPMSDYCSDPDPESDDGDGHGLVHTVHRKRKKQRCYAQSSRPAPYPRGDSPVLYIYMRCIFANYMQQPL